MTHHANGDADLLIVKTAVESARTNTTVLVGDDTDLLVLLCYQASKDGCDLYFRPEPKANARGTRVWHMKRVKDHLGREACTNLLSVLTTSPGATPHRACMELARQQPSRNLRTYHTSEIKLISLAVILLNLTFSLQVKRHMSHFSVVSQGLVLTLSGVSDTLKNLPRRHLINSHRIFPQLQRRPDFTSCASTFK